MKGEIIRDIKAREILDSRGFPTIEVEVVLESGDRGIAQIPAGASKGKYEAMELRDGEERFLGKGVKRAVNNVKEVIKREIVGLPASDQALIDSILKNLDGTERKERLGANAILGVSIAVCKAAANFYHLPVYRYLGGIREEMMPVPLLNIINGGVHAPNNLTIQEFMIVPLGAQTFTDALRYSVEVYHTLKKLLEKKKLLTGVGDEGGFCPNLSDNEEALKLTIEAIETANYEPGIDIFLALDSAASEFYQGGRYHLLPEDKKLNAEEMIKLYEDWVAKYPIVSIEDGLAQEDWSGWEQMTSALGKKVQLVGDDLFVTNITLLKKGVNKGIANAILIKPNQVGTISETLECIAYAQREGYKTIASHRSGETEDTFIAHLAFATNTYQIKTGAPSRGERVAKYNELLRIEEATRAKYAGNHLLRKEGQ